MGLILNAFRLIVGGGSGYDADADAYFTATGLSDITKMDALNDLVIGLKADGLWTECVAIFPFPGDTAAINSVNLKSPGTFDLIFFGGLTHSSTGMLPDGSTGYADTGLVPSTYLATGDTHLSYYSRTANTYNKVDIGCFTGVNYHGLALRIYYSGDTAFSYAYDGGSSLDRANLNSSGNSNSQGFYVGSRTSGTSHYMYKNAIAGTQVTNLTGNFPSITDTVKIGAASHDGTIPSSSFYGNRECAFASIGFGLDSTQVSDLYTLVQAYQTALGRQV